jgi:hypothetical protein
MTDESLEEFIARFRQRFPKEEKGADPFGDWLFTQRRFSFYWESKTTPFPLLAIEQYIMPVEGTHKELMHSSHLTQTLFHQWSSRDKEKEKALAVQLWQKTLHQVAQDNLIACRKDDIVCAVYRFAEKDLEPISHTTGKFFGKKEQMSGSVTLHYQLYRKR